MEPVPQGNLNDLPVSVLQDGAGVINRCPTRKGFRRGLLSAPKEKPFLSARNVSERTDRPREEFPRREGGCPSSRAAKEDGLCPLLNNFGRRSDAMHGSPVAITVSPYAPVSALERLHNDDEPESTFRSTTCELNNERLISQRCRRKP